MRAVPGDTPPAAPPHRVTVPVNIHHWDDITFLHWPFEPRDVAPMLPDRLAVLTHDGAAWLTVTPFVMRVRPPGVPVIPPGCSFPETNLRTYVVGPDGRQGLWFLRMEVTALWFVATLRALGLPYFRNAMSVERGPERIVYASRPRPGSAGGGHHIVVRPGAALDPPVGDSWDRFVTARWAAFHRRGPVLFWTPVEHQPWPLRHAAVEACEVAEVFRDARLPAPAGAPGAHFSPGVTVKVGPPRIV